MLSSENWSWEKKPLKNLKDVLKDSEQKKRHQQKCLDNREKYLGSLYKVTRKIITGKEISSSEFQKNIYNSALIETICQMAISGTIADGRRRSKLIREVVTLAYLTLVLHSERFEFVRSSVDLWLYRENPDPLKGKDTFIQYCTS